MSKANRRRRYRHRKLMRKWDERMRRIEAVAKQYAELFGTNLVISEEKVYGRTMRVNPPLVLPLFYRADESGHVSISVCDDGFGIDVDDEVPVGAKDIHAKLLKQYVLDRMISYWDVLTQISDDDLSHYLRVVKKMYATRVTVE